MKIRMANGAHDLKFGTNIGIDNTAQDMRIVKIYVHWIFIVYKLMISNGQRCITCLILHAMLCTFLFATEASKAIQENP